MLNDPCDEACEEKDRMRMCVRKLFGNNNNHNTVISTGKTVNDRQRDDHDLLVDRGDVQRP